jgi:hypothetical protein
VFVILRFAQLQQSNMPIQKLVRLALSCSFALGLAACADEEKSGNLTIEYELGFSAATCSAEGVVQIRATFREGLDEIEACNDEGEFTASGIPAGSYSLFLLEGLDAQNITIYDSLGDPDARPAKVVGGSTQTHQVGLSPTPAQVEVSFNLLDENGFAYAGQAESPVTEFEVIAADNDSELHRHTFVVAQLDSPVGNIVPDEGRDINGERLSQVRIDYTAGGDDMTVTVEGANLFMFPPPGHGRVVPITVTCEADVCTGELNPIEGVDLTAGESSTDSATGGDSSG